MRATFSAVLGVVGCLLAALTVVAVWASSQVLDTDRYVESVRPLASDTAVQNEVADQVTRAITERIDPGQPGGLTEQVVGSTTQELVRSPAFAPLWVETNRQAHGQVRALLKEEGSGALAVQDERVTLDLGSVVKAVLQRLAADNPDVVDALPPIELQVEVADAQDVDRARRVVRLLDTSAAVLPFVTPVVLVGAVLLAGRRLRAVGLLGLGIALAAGLTWLLVGVGERLAVSWSADAVRSGDAVRAFSERLTSWLSSAELLLVLAGLVVGVVGLIAHSVVSREVRD